MAIGFATAIIELRAVDLLSKPLRGMAGTLSSIGMGISQVGLALSAGLTVPIVAAGAAIVKATTDFDESMRKVQTISKESDASLKNLGQRFIDMSTDITKTVDTPKKLAEAYYDLIQRFSNATVAQEVLAVATKSATAGFVDTIEAGKAIGSVISAYNMDFREAGHVSDVLFRTVDRGNITYRELVQNLGDVNSIAARMGVTLEEAGAAVATMTLRGVPASEAFTRLKRILISVVAPSDSAMEAMDDVGIAYGLTAIKTKGLLPYLVDINQKLGGNAQALHDIFPRQEAFLGFLDLMSGGAADFTDALAYMSDATGATDKAFATATKSFTAQFANFKNQATALALSFGEVLMPILIKFAGQITEVVKAFRALPDATKEAIVRFAIFAAIIGPFLLVAGQVVVMLGTLFAMLASLSGVVIALFAPVGFLIGLFGMWRENTFELRRVMEELSGQAGKLGGVASALQTLFKTMEKIDALEWRVDWGSAFGTVQTQAITFANVVGEGLKQIALLLIETRGTIENLAWAFSFIVEAVKIFVTYATNVLPKVTDLLKNMAGVAKGVAMGFLALLQMDPLRAIGYFDKASLALNKTIDIQSELLRNATVAWMNLRFEQFRYGYQIGQTNEKVKAQQDAIKGLDLAKIIQQHIDWSGALNLSAARVSYLEQKEMGLLTAIGKLGKKTEEQSESVGNSYDSIGKDAQAMRDKVVGAYADMLKAGEAWAAKLAPETAAKILDPFSPNNPDSPFQPFFRILDVAEHWGPGKKPGIDTAKWAEMYFPGMSVEEQAAGAKEISKKFMTGYWDPAMRAILGPEGIARMREIAKEQKITEALRLAFAELITGDEGVQAGIVADAGSSPIARQIPTAILGFSDPKVVQGATDDMLGTLLPAISQSITDNQENLASKGGQVWGALEGGIIQAAKDSGALYKAVQAMVGAALASAMGP